MRRLQRRSELQTSGSIFAAEGECGRDQLPCGICWDCEVEGVLDPSAPAGRLPDPILAGYDAMARRCGACKGEGCSEWQQHRVCVTGKDVPMGRQLDICDKEQVREDRRLDLEQVRRARAAGLGNGWTATDRRQREDARGQTAGLEKRSADRERLELARAHDDER